MPELRHYNPIWVTTQPIAHRGLHSAGVPENTLAAFAAAADAGYAIELDIRLTADGRIVVIHDPTTGRVAGQDLSVATTPAAKLTKLNLLNTRETIPLLADVFAGVHGRVPILIEIKTGSPMRVLGPTLIGLLANYSGEVAVESFDPRILMWLRRHAPAIPRGQLAGTLPEKPWPYLYRLFLRSMILNIWARPDFIAFDLRDYPTRMAVFWRHRMHIPVITWTVRRPDQLALAQHHRLNVIFENVRPSLPSN